MKRRLGAISLPAILILVAACQPKQVDQRPTPPSSNPGPESGGTLYALDSEAGLVLWRRPFQHSAVPVSVKDGTVYLTELLGDDAAVVRALDLKTGREKWHRRLALKALEIDRVVVGRLHLYVRVDHDPSSSSIFALDREKGEILWRFSPHDVLEGPLASSDSVYVGEANSKTVLALDHVTGQQRWRFSSDGVLADLELGRAALLVLTHGGSLYQLDLSRGPSRKRTQLKDAVIEAISAISSELAFVVGRSSLQPGLEGMVLHAIELGSGKERWRFERPLLGFGEQDVSHDHRNVYIVGFAGVSHPAQLYALDLETGMERWRREAAFPEADGAAVYASTGTAPREKLIALEPVTGREVWSVDYRGQSFSSPLVSGDLVFLGTTAGRIIAVQKTNGLVKWVARTGEAVVLPPIAADGLLLVSSTSSF